MSTGTSITTSVVIDVLGRIVHKTLQKNSTKIDLEQQATLKCDPGNTASMIDLWLSCIDRGPPETGYTESPDYTYTYTGESGETRECACARCARLRKEHREGTDSAPNQTVHIPYAPRRSMCNFFTSRCMLSDVDMDQTVSFVSEIAGTTELKASLKTNIDADFVNELKVATPMWPWDRTEATSRVVSAITQKSESISEQTSDIFKTIRGTQKITVSNADAYALSQSMTLDIASTILSKSSTVVSLITEIESAMSTSTSIPSPDHFSHVVMSILDYTNYVMYTVAGLLLVAIVSSILRL